MTGASPTEKVIRLITKLKEKNAFDHDAICRLAESVDKVETLLDNARHLNSQEKRAFSKAFDAATAPINWDEVRQTLQGWIAPERKREEDRADASSEAAPLWNLQSRTHMLSDRHAHLHKVARISDGRKTRYLLHSTSGASSELVLLERNNFITYSLDLDWSPMVDLALHRDGQTFVPTRRTSGPAACGLILLEQGQALIDKIANYWSQPIGWLYHRDELLFLIARGDPSVRGIAHVDIASLKISEPTKVTWYNLSLISGGVQVCGLVQCTFTKMRSGLSSRQIAGLACANCSGRPKQLKPFCCSGEANVPAFVSMDHDIPTTSG